MKRITVVSGAAAVLMAGVCGTQAQISLEEIALSLDGTLGDFFKPFTGADVPSGAGANFGGFSVNTGLGIIKIVISAPGTHSVVTFFDHDIDLAPNGYINEVGFAIGSPAAGQSWEIDEPGFGAKGYTGNIFDHVQSSTSSSSDLDNSVGTNNPDDVSMALGETFVLGAGDVATVTFSLSTTKPAGFYLDQNDPDSGKDIYFTSKTLIVNGHTGGPGVPETGTTLFALMIGVVGLAAFNYKFGSRAV